jgi:hypothetical protein
MGISYAKILQNVILPPVSAEIFPPAKERALLAATPGNPKLSFAAHKKTLV